MPRRHRRATDHGRGRPRSLTTAPRGLPSHRPRGVLIALALHVAALLAIFTAGYLQLLSTSARMARQGPSLMVTIVDEATAAAAAPVLALDGPKLEHSSRTAPFQPSPGMAPFDTARIEARRDELFPFLTARMGFLDRLRLKRTPPRDRPRPAPNAPRIRETTPLALSPREIDALVDRSWSRRDRWRNLAPIIKLAGDHDPDDGQLPALVRAYGERNLLQPYFPGATPDARFWIVLGLASDHADVLRFVGRYVDEHPRTRTATEMLFLLDQLVEASRDAFHLLRLTDLDSLERTARFSGANLALARRLQQGYGEWAFRRGLGKNEDLDHRIEQIRMDILSAIVETSPDGYGASDARFLIGRSLWTSKDYDGAARWWRAMGRDMRNSYAEVRADVARAVSPGGDVDHAAVTAALNKEYGRWLRLATQRLAKFGFTPTTY